MISKYPALSEYLNEINTIDQTAFEEISEEIDIVLHKLKFIPTETLPKVLIIDENTPSVAVTPLMQELVRAAGGILLDPNDPSSPTQADKLLFAQDAMQLYGKLPFLLSEPPYQSAPAVAHDEIYIIENNDFGKRSIDHVRSTLEILAEIVQPKYFIYGRQGTDWTRFELT